MTEEEVDNLIADVLQEAAFLAGERKFAKAEHIAKLLHNGAVNIRNLSASVFLQGLVKQETEEEYFDRRQRTADLQGALETNEIP